MVDPRGNISTMYWLGRRRAGVALLAFALLLNGLVWALTLPAFDGPDEPAHFDYAQLLGLRGRLPVNDANLQAGPDVNALITTTLVVPDFGLSARFYPERLGSGSQGAREAQVAAIPPDPGAHTPAGQYGPTAYLLFGAAVRLARPGGVMAELLAARLVAVCLGVLAAMVAMWAAREAGLGRKLAISVAVLVGLQPMWAQQTAIVSNEAAVLLCSSLFIALTLRWLRRPSARVALLASASLGIGLLTKPSMAFALPFLAIFALPAFGRKPRAQRLLGLLTAATCGLLAAGPLLLWSLHTAPAVPSGSSGKSLAAYWTEITANNAGYLHRIFDSFWGDFGWLEQKLPAGVLFALGVVFVLATTLALVGLWRMRSRRAGIFLASLVIANVAFLLYFDTRLWSAQGGLSLQGRYLLPVLPAMVILPVIGLRTITTTRLRSLLAPALVAAAIALDIVALATLWGRYYVA
ncbi:MAG TPA: DUF2142 domain-containing protein [Candidatus Dormibacteraeota bacterium]